MCSLSPLYYEPSGHMFLLDTSLWKQDLQHSCHFQKDHLNLIAQYLCYSEAVTAEWNSNSWKVEASSFSKLLSLFPYSALSHSYELQGFWESIVRVSWLFQKLFSVLNGIGQDTAQETFIHTTKTNLDILCSEDLSLLAPNKINLSFLLCHHLTGPSRDECNIKP